MKLCECGCGEPAPIAVKTSTGQGYIKGEPHRFIAGHGARVLNPRTPFVELFKKYVAVRGEFHECWLWTGRPNGAGYGTCHYEGKKMGAHVATYLMFHGALPEGCRVVRHTCDMRMCCNPAHLLAGTHADNTRDMHERGRSNRATKLSKRDVKNIRAEFTGKRGEQAILADRYGVSRATINLIIKRRNWKNV